MRIVCQENQKNFIIRKVNNKNKVRIGNNNVEYEWDYEQAKKIKKLLEGYFDE